MALNTTQLPVPIKDKVPQFVSKKVVNFLLLGHDRPEMKDLNNIHLELELLNSRQLGRQELLETTENDFIKDGSEIYCRKMFIKWLGTYDASWDKLD